MFAPNMNTKNVNRKSPIPRLSRVLDMIVSRRPDFACLQEVDIFSTFYRRNFNLKGYNTLYAKRLHHKDGVCIAYSSAYTCEHNFVVQFDELAKESDKLDQRLVSAADERFNMVFEPNAQLRERALRVKGIEIPKPKELNRNQNSYLKMDKSALIGIFRHNQSTFFWAKVLFVAGERLIVATTHLLWQPALSQAKLFQSIMMMCAIQAVRDAYGGLPLFLTMDSNSQPYSKVYNYYRFLFLIFL